VLAEHPSNIGTGKVLPKSTTDEDDIDALAPASLCVARDRPTHYCSSVDQFANQRIKLSGLRLLSKHEKTLVCLLKT
jgi:hypothetical protein